MTTLPTATHAATVHHSVHTDPFLLRRVHSYRPVCECNWRGALTADEPAANREALRHIGDGK